jgi:hypothetical protein
MDVQGERLEIGQTIGLGLQTIAARALPFAALVLVVGGLDGLSDTHTESAARGGYFLSSVLTLVTEVLATYYALKVRCGDDLVIKMAFGRALGVNFLSGIGILLGLVLLIVPGIYLIAIWSLALPALMAEDLSVSESLSRSKALTEGHRLVVLGLMLLISIPSMLFVFGSASLAETFWGENVGEMLVYNVVVNVIAACASVLSSVLMAEAYITLSGQRNRLGALREIFA